MLAISRDNLKVFLYEPSIGLSVPVTLDVEKRAIDVAVPDMSELETEFAAVDDLDEVKEAVPRHSKLVDAMASFSRFYSTHFRDEIDTQDIPIARLRELIVKHYSSLAPSAGRPRREQAVQALPAFDALKASFEY